MSRARVSRVLGTLCGMADVVRVHLNGFTYTHATATSLADPMIAGLAATLRTDQTVNPQPPMQLDVKADAGTTTLTVFPQRVWGFAAWVGPAPTTSTGGTGVGVGVGL